MTALNPCLVSISLCPLLTQVIWNTKSFQWNIRNFTDICGLRADQSSKDGYGVNEADIENIQSSQEFNCLLDIDFLQSPVIEVGDSKEGSQSQWLVRLMKSLDDENNIDLYMELLPPTETDLENDDGSTECFFRYKIQIVGSDGQCFLKKDTNKIIFLKSGKSWCEPALIQVETFKKHLEEVLQDDTLNLQIDLFVLNDLKHATSNGQIPQVMGKKRKCTSSDHGWEEVLNSCQLKLAKQVLNNLWKTNLNADVTIECANSTFSVHKSILSSVSPVFSAAFTHDMYENAENRIVINDMSPIIMETVLRFIYCDTNLEEHQWISVDDLADLLNAAEKYQIVTLKNLCFSKLCAELTLNNAAQITALVYLFQPEECVKKFVHEYVIRNISILKDMERFKKKMKEVPAAFTPLLLLIGD